EQLRLVGVDHHAQGWCHAEFLAVQGHWRGLEEADPSPLLPQPILGKFPGSLNFCLLISGVNFHNCLCEFSPLSSTAIQ
ncbi:MAG TPA: hypothetical protein VJ575_00730, partial [Pseudogulbenkiania sp.]|nr:hypothetical protein [Pseudogulbenkiania sp.]